jgi:hypothetical protein
VLLLRQVDNNNNNNNNNAAKVSKDGWVQNTARKQRAISQSQSPIAFLSASSPSDHPNKDYSTHHHYNHPSRSIHPHDTSPETSAPQ